MISPVSKYRSLDLIWLSLSFYSFDYVVVACFVFTIKSIPSGFLYEATQTTIGHNFHMAPFRIMEIAPLSI